MRLRNPEYDITRTIKKVLYSWRGGGDLFSGLTKPVTLHAYISDPAQLPEPLPALAEDLRAVLKDLAQTSKGRFDFTVRDPDADGGALAKEIGQRFGFQPLVLGLLDPKPFWFYLVLDSGGQATPIPLPEETSKAGLKRAIEAGIKRLAPGYLKTLAIYTPPETGGFPGMPGMGGGGFSALQEGLKNSVTLRPTDLADGRVPGDADLLLVVAAGVVRREPGLRHRPVPDAGRDRHPGRLPLPRRAGRARHQRPGATHRARGMAHPPGREPRANPGPGPAQHALPDPGGA